MKYIYLLRHIHTFSDGSESIKLIGAYSSKKQVQSAIERAKILPGFRELAEGFEFETDKYCINEDNWTEGFVTLD